MIHIFVGKPGSGKTTKLAKICLRLFERNQKYYNAQLKQYKLDLEDYNFYQRWGKRNLRTPIDYFYNFLSEYVSSDFFPSYSVPRKPVEPVKRIIFSNVLFSKEIEEKFHGWFKYWVELDELWKARDVDIIWQEMAAYLDSQEYEKVPRELKRWLQLHRHYGIEIFGDTQDFPMIDISVRRITANLYKCVKLIGSRDRSTTKPDPLLIWGLVLLLNVDDSTFAEDKQDYKFTGWSLMWLTPRLCSVFNSYEDLQYDSWPPLKHIERYCTDENCPQHGRLHGKPKIVHA